MSQRPFDGNQWYNPYGGGETGDADFPGDLVYTPQNAGDPNIDPNVNGVDVPVEPEVATDYGYWTRPLGGGPFQAPTRPGSFGSFGGGPGGSGMVAGVGEFDPGPGFQSPVGVVEYEQFQAPTMADVQATPGYEFRRREGERAIENAAAAGGMTRTGGTMKDLIQYGQNYATGEYDKAYGRALGENQLGYQRAMQSNADQYGRALGEYQMGYGQRGDVYGANMERAMAEARMAEGGAGRNLAAQRMQYDAREREYNDLYARQRENYQMGREEDRWQDAREWDRHVGFPTMQGQQARQGLG